MQCFLTIQQVSCLLGRAVSLWIVTSWIKNSSRLEFAPVHAYQIQAVCPELADEIF